MPKAIKKLDFSSNVTTFRFLSVVKLKQANKSNFIYVYGRMFTQQRIFDTNFVVMYIVLYKHP